jgi:hypothetical protein
MIISLLHKPLLYLRTPLFLKVFISAVVICTAASCSKDESLAGRTDYIIVSESEDKNTVVTKVEMPIEGGTDTLFVFANSDFETFFQTNNEQEWVSVESSEYLERIKATRLILKIEPLTGNFKKRSGVLNLANKNKILGQFIKVDQGYTSRLSEDFLWLKYGNGSPFNESTDVLIDKWSAAQKANQWTSTIPAGIASAQLSGKNGYVKLGSTTTGADLISPNISGLEKDSVLLLTFNAVAFTSLSGEADENKLTIKILNGGEFDSGSNVVELNLGYYDPQSSLITTNMWNNSFHSFQINKPKLSPNTSTMQIQFLTGDDLHTSKNRIFLDNISLYSVAQKK